MKHFIHLHNKKRFSPVAIVLLLVTLFCTTCSHTSDGPTIIPDAVKDVDGNFYDAVVIGSQTWMQTNLRTRHFRNGSPIPVGKTYPDAESNSSSPYAYDPSETYFPNGYDSKRNGLQYNVYAVIDERGLCPEGWHTPSTEEWGLLIRYASTRQTGLHEYDIGQNAKALASKTGWTKSPYLGTPGHHPQANNSTGFDACPNGFRPSAYSYTYYYDYPICEHHYSNYTEHDAHVQCASFWVNCLHAVDDPYDWYYIYIQSDVYNIYFAYEHPKACLPVRCIKDLETKIE